MGTTLPRQRGHDGPLRVAADETRAHLDAGVPGWLRVHGFHVEVVLALTAVVATGLLAGGGAAAVLGLTGLWLTAVYHRGVAVTSPVNRQLWALAHGSVLSVAGAAAGVALAGSAPVVIDQAMMMSLTGVAVAGGCRLLRWRLQTPVRVVVVGDRVAVAQGVARWAGKSNLRVVGGVVVEPDLSDDAVPADIMGVPVLPGLDDTGMLARRLGADLVVVSPGPGFTSLDFRRLGWALEGTHIRYAVMGVLDAVAAHRIMPGGLAGATLMDIRPPRPAAMTRVAKEVLDRAAAAVLLVLLAPVLLAMTIAVRLDSPGPALFSQTRVGKDGRPFRIWKIRTMVTGAEQLKQQLLDRNEQDGVLFKISDDPRVTRVGRFLRTTSLDELPQLVNVLRGEMSLVGPRPHLPAEVELMAPDHLRRHAVKPGITGLWQISGRSDLSTAAAAELDTYYADNWSLVGDAQICLKTVQAVAAGKGAY